MNNPELHQELLHMKNFGKMIITLMIVIQIPLFLYLLHICVGVQADIADLKKSISTHQQINGIEADFQKELQFQRSIIMDKLIDQDQLNTSQQSETKRKLDDLSEMISNLTADNSDLKKYLLLLSGAGKFKDKKINTILTNSLSQSQVNSQDLDGNAKEASQQPLQYASVARHSEGDVPIYYKVQKGDTLYSISQNFGVPVETIVNYNNLKNHEISVNQKLLIEYK